jgi:hypothetical protein
VIMRESVSRIGMALSEIRSPSWPLCGQCGYVLERREWEGWERSVVGGVDGDGKRDLR